MYNENPTGAVYPTPVIGMVGLIESLSHVTRSSFVTDGDAIILLGNNTDELGGSEYLQRIHGEVIGPPPRVDLAGEKALIAALLDAIRAGTIRSAHDVADGGLAVALAECVMMDRANQVGAQVDLSAWASLPMRALLFGEAQGRVIVTTPDPAAVTLAAARHRVPCAVIGAVRSSSGVLDLKVGTRQIRASVRQLADAYHEAIPRIMQRSASAQDVALASDAVV